MLEVVIVYCIPFIYLDLLRNDSRKHALLPYKEGVILDRNIQKPWGSFTLHFGLKYEIIYQLDAIEYLFVFFQLGMFRAYTPIFRSNGCYNFFTYAAYGVLGVVRCRS